ncbi:MAG: hypothetical protein ACTS3T_23855, partial [Almyronema sp.]
ALSPTVIELQRVLNSFAFRNMHDPLNSKKYNFVIKLTYWLNRFFPAWIDSQKKKEMRAFVASQVSDYYNSSNQITSSLIEVSLQSLGYS